MRAGSLVLVGAALALVGLGAACGLDRGGNLDAPADASVDSAHGHDASLADARGSGADDATVDTSAGGDEGDDGGADADASDATPDVVDAGPCDGGVVCNGACMLGAPNCVTCPGAPLLCGATGTCGADCTACAGLPIQCFNCDSNRTNAVGTCEAFDSGTYCLDDNDYPDDHCACPTNSETDCPGATQTCCDRGGFLDPGNVCKTCGEANTEGQPCKGRRVRPRDGDLPVTREETW